MVSFIIDLCAFSPNGLYLACVIQTDRRILVRNCDKCPPKTRYSNSNRLQSSENKFKVEHSFSLEPETSPICEISWSPDSLFIGASCKKGSVLSLHSLRDKNWKCKLSFGRLEEAGGGIGLETFWWGRDARHLLCLSEGSVVLSVWSIHRKSVHYINDIAKIREGGHSFSPDGSHLAIGQVDPSSKFYIGLYSCKTWKKEKSFYVATKDLAGISWSPSPATSTANKGQAQTRDSVIVCWDSPLFSNLYIYSAQSGHLLKHYSPFGLASGFDSVQWSSGAHFLICTAHGRNEVHVLNGLTFGVLIHDVLEPIYLDSPSMSKGDSDARLVIFLEVTVNDKSGRSEYRKVSQWPTPEESPPTKLHLPGLEYSWNKGAYIKLHQSGSHLACMTQLYPKVLWIYHLHTARLAAVLIHETPILDYDWSPTCTKLAIICSCSSPNSEGCSGQIYLWTTNDGNNMTTCSAYIRSLQVAPTKYSKRSSLRWSPHGDLLTLRDHDANRLHMFSNF